MLAERKGAPASSIPCLFMKPEPDIGRGSGQARSALMSLYIVDDVLNGPDLLGIFVRDFHAVFFLQRHHQLHDIERVGAQVLDKRCLWRNFIRGYSKLFADNLADL